MSRQFIRTLFGPLTDQLRSEITFLMTGPEREHNSPFVCYTCGREGHEFVTSLGATSELVSEEPWIYEGATSAAEKGVTGGTRFTNKWVIHHKLHLLRVAAHAVDELVVLDWDCLQVAPLPEAFWSDLAAGEPFRAPLYYYPGGLRLWPGALTPGLWSYGPVRIPEYSCYPVRFAPVPNGGFVYVRGSDLADRFMQLSDTLPLAERITDETVYALWAQEQLGGEFTLEAYLERFEPRWCDGAVEGTGFRQSSALALHLERRGLRTDKDIVFWHHAGEDTVRGYRALKKYLGPQEIKRPWLREGRGVLDRYHLRGLLSLRGLLRWFRR